MPGMLDGAHDIPLIPFNPTFAGIDIGQALVVPNGGNVFYVRGNGTSTTEYTYDPPGVRERLVAGVNKAMSYCVGGRGDVICCLEGHAETIGNDGDAWGNIVANVKVVGRGNGAARPTFTFNHANAQIDVDAASVLFYNMRFLAAGPAGTTALTVVNPFNVTAPDFQFVKNYIEVGIDADQLCTDAIKLSATADDATLAYNYMRGASGAAINSVVTTTGAVDRLKLFSNVITADVATAATGVLFDLSNAALADNLILNNYLANNTASSKFVIKPHASSTGLVEGNIWFVGDSATVPVSLGWSTFTTNYKFGRNNGCVTTTGVSAIVCPAVDS